MDWKTFISNLVGSLAWPAAAIVLLLLLRVPITRLVPLLRRLKWKDLELDFAEKLEQAEKVADAAELPPARPALLEKTGINSEKSSHISLRQLATTAPRAAIAEAWRRLEWRIRDAVKQLGVEPPNSLSRLIRVARERNILPPQVMGLFDDLRELRNQAVHGRHFEVDAARALEYVELAERVAAALPGAQALDDAGEAG